MEAHATEECRGCEWERYPQAFRWFPELGQPWTGSAEPDRDRSPATAVGAAAGGRVRPG